MRRFHTRMSDRYLITEVRERKDNEFLFGCGERVVACTEFLRFLDFFRDQGWDIKYIDERSLPKDYSGNRMVGYTVTRRKEGVKEWDDSPLKKNDR